MTEGSYDVCVVGAGLIGLATATALVDSYPGLALAVVDKEPEVAAHQSSHNSGVVHSGLYYRPGSLKARLAVAGRRAVYEFCELHDIPVDRSGKLVIATAPSELPALAELERRGHANGLVGLKRIDSEEIKSFEPAAVGIAALHVPEAGVVDYPAMARQLEASLLESGVDVLTDFPVTGIRDLPDGVSVLSGERAISARALVNCAGLQSDLVARLGGVEPAMRIVPFRGEYYKLSDEAASLVRALIYPVPDPRFPFLGVHFTRRIDGSVEVGPNAVVALGREHYRGVEADWHEVLSFVRYRGFRKLALRNLKSGSSELLNSKSTRLYARLARRLVPGLHQEHLLPGGAGVRAQALDRNGNLLDDFVIELKGRTVHVLNAPSPGATASIAIGRHIAEEIRPVWLS